MWWAENNRGRRSFVDAGSSESVRSVFTAGITPSRIARQFGIIPIAMCEALANGRTEAGLHIGFNQRDHIGLFLEFGPSYLLFG